MTMQNAGTQIIISIFCRNCLKFFVPLQPKL
nr:MAG TPA: Protein of unknown function (DUF1244) [Caudoviricetes sp.]